MAKKKRRQGEANGERTMRVVEPVAAETVATEPVAAEMPAVAAEAPVAPPAPVIPEERTTVEPRPKLRLLRFDEQGRIEQTLSRIAETTGRGEDVRKLFSLVNGAASSAEERILAHGLVSRLGEALAAPRATQREFDAFGREPAFEQRALELLSTIYKHYFRVEVRGIEHLPAKGPVIVVANHSGALPWDMLMLKCAVALEHPTRRSLRPLAEDFVFHFPFLGTLVNRFGAVRACPENAEALLAAGEAVAVFPEGAKGLGKPFSRRYRLQRFGRGGFVKLALRSGAPVVPVAIVGAEETYPLLARLPGALAPFGIPYLPLTPTFPFLGPLGLLPLPTKWRIEFGPAVTLDDGGRGDELSIERLTEDVRTDIQARIDRMLAQRRGPFF